MPTISVLIACHNRKALTLACLENLFAQALPDGFTLALYLVDDGSTDGTADAVNRAYPDAVVLRRDGSLFWSRSMRAAWEAAAKSDPDFYLWLNDDAMLSEGAISTLLSTWRRSHAPAIVVGSCCDPITGRFTYGGQRRMGGHPARIEPIPPRDIPVACDTFQSNVLLVPREVYQRVGMIHPFQHAMGDIDYGYRAKQAGCHSVIAPGFLATCELNQATSYWHKGPSRRERWRLLNSRKGMPFRDWLWFVRRHGGPAWPIYWVSPYLRVLLNR